MKKASKIKTEHIVVDGIDIKVIYKPIKNLYIRIGADGVPTVSVPSLVSKKNAESFIVSRIDWIKSHLPEYGVKNKVGFDNGEKLYVWGKEYTVRIDGSLKIKSPIIDGEYIVIGAGQINGDRDKLLHGFYRKIISDKVVELISKWEDITGLKSSGFRLKYMKTRWGSCNVKTAKINLNIRLAQYPQECLESVILHELCHIKVPNHSAEFHALYNSYSEQIASAERILKKDKKYNII